MQLLSGTDAASAGMGRLTSPNHISWHGDGLSVLPPSPTKCWPATSLRPVDNLHLFNIIANAIQI